LRQPVAVEPPRHLEHGQADGAGAGHHHVRGGTVPAGADGSAARKGEESGAGYRCTEDRRLGRRGASAAPAATRAATADVRQAASYEASAAGVDRSTITCPSFTSVRKVLRSTKQGACTALPVRTLNAPKCRLHSITSPSRMPSARSAVAWVQRASVA